MVRSRAVEIGVKTREVGRNVMGTRLSQSKRLKSTSTRREHWTDVLYHLYRNLRVGCER